MPEQDPESQLRLYSSDSSEATPSPSTTPLATDHFSSRSNEDLSSFYVSRTRIDRESFTEQSPIRTRRLTRKSCKKDAELVELNYGIDFSKLK